MRVRRLATLLLVVLCALGLAAGDADAGKRKKKKGRKAPAAQKAPQADSRAVSELMGKFKWGMPKEKVLGILYKEIDAKYAELREKTTDVYEQDQLKKKANAEKRRIKDSLVEFDGRTTGWDVSIIDKEFGQKNDESMLVLWENDPESGKDQRRFFFFVDGKLWKMFIAFNTEMFQGKTFQDFKQIMEARYGTAKAELVDDVPTLQWSSPKARLRAIDLNRFYGIFALAISDPGVEAWIADRRQERNPTVEKQNTIVKSITEDEQGQEDLRDPNVDVIDRITGGGN